MLAQEMDMKFWWLVAVANIFTTEGSNNAAFTQLNRICQIGPVSSIDKRCGAYRNMNISGCLGKPSKHALCHIWQSIQIQNKRPWGSIPI